jgi:hypothetical protein
VQRLILAEVIDQPLTLTVMRSGALIDSIVKPVELDV